MFGNWKVRVLSRDCDLRGAAATRAIMRNADETLDEAQLALSSSIERMLTTDEWQSANTSTYDGLCQRFEMMKAEGVPAMRVVPAATIAKLGRIPRSDEGHQVDAYEAVRRLGPDNWKHPKAVLVFFSHRWKRPAWCQALGMDVAWGSPEHKAAQAAGHAIGDVDGPAHEKASALIELSKWLYRDRLKSKVADDKTRDPLVPPFSGALTFAAGFAFMELPQCDDLEIFYWIDWPCVDQTNPAADMAALPATAAICHMAVTAWSADYSSRAWCQVELMMMHAFNTTGAAVLVVEEGFVDTNQPRVQSERVTVPDPAGGDLTNENDRSLIIRLREVSTSSTAFTCWRNFVKRSTQGDGPVWNVLLCGQCFGLIPYSRARDVRPGKGKLTKLMPTHSRGCRLVPGRAGEPRISPESPLAEYMQRH